MFLFNGSECDANAHHVSVLVILLKSFNQMIELSVNEDENVGLS